MLKALLMHVDSLIVGLGVSGQDMLPACAQAIFSLSSLTTHVTQSFKRTM